MSVFTKIDSVTDFVIELSNTTYSPVGGESWYELETDFEFTSDVIKNVWKYMGSTEIQGDLFVEKGLRSAYKSKELNEYDYAGFIEICNNKGLRKQYKLLEENGTYKNYFLFAFDSFFQLFCYINTDDHSDDVATFETAISIENWNDQIMEIDTYTGALKIKPRPVSGTLYDRFIYLTTGTSTGFDAGGVDWWTIDVSTPGMTKIKMSPQFHYDIDGGQVTLIGTVPTNDIKVMIWMAPQIPFEAGGQIPFIENKKFIFDNEQYKIETTSKHISYIPAVPQANECEVIFTHHPDDRINFELMLNIFREW